MPERIQFTDARDGLKGLLDSTQHRGERFVLCRRKEPAGALVSMDDLALLEALEDAHDVALGEKRLAEFKASGEASIPVEEAFRKLDS